MKNRAKLSPRAIFPAQLTPATLCLELNYGSSPTRDQADQKKDQKNEEEDLRDACGSPGDSAKAENSRNNRDYKKHQRVMQHFNISIFGLRWIRLEIRRCCQPD